MASQETNVSFDEQVTKEVTSNTACIDVSSSSQLSTLASRQLSSLNREGHSLNISKEISERFFKCCDFEWKQAHGFGTLLQRIVVPNDIIEKSMIVPNGAVLMPYVYGHFDSLVKVIVNCNRFQVGQLQVSWCYMGQGVKANTYDNIHLNSQRPHAIFSASANNVVEFVIPFKFVYPYVCLRRFGLNKELANMISIDIRVLSPLMSNSSTYDRVRGTVLFAFRNFVGHGMVPIGIARHEMLSIGVAGVEAMLKKTKNVYNLDNPSNPQVKTTVVPYASHSWANGTNVIEELNILRLDPTAIVCHPNQELDEMNIKNITRTYGLLRTQPWKMNDQPGKIIAWYPVLPLMKFDRYPISSGENVFTRMLECRNLPPIAVLTSMFANWRGGIEFRIDVIRTMMHTGRLILSYLPLARDGKVKFKNDWEEPSLNHLYGGYYLMMDLGGDENSFSFTIPFVSNRPWLPVSSNNRNVFGDENFSHGCVFLAVVNSLIPMDAVPDHININIYIRAGLDFELSVLSKPLLGLSINREYSYKYDKVLIKPGYYPCYAGSWHNWVNGDKYYYILRYGSGIDHVVQVEGNIYYDTYYSILDSNKQGVVVTVKEKDKLVRKEARYFFIPNKPSDSNFKGYNYLVPCLTAQQAINCIKTVGTDGPACGIDWVQDSSEYWADSNIILIPRLERYNIDVIHEMDERKVDSLSHNIGSMGCSLNSANFYNESFDRLKDLCRRYQLYAESTFRIDENYGFGSVVLMIPLYPGGLQFDYTVGHLVNDSFNFTRDGIIPLIASGFRYFRGGLRFKIILTSKDSKDVVFSITHMPDCFYEPKLKYLKPNGLNRDYVSSGYASYKQSTRVNEIFEVEIPYYLQSDYGLLVPQQEYTQENMRICSLGSIAIAVMSRVEKIHDFSIQVYYSLADDMLFSEFQGFPSMVNALDIPGFRQIRLVNNNLNSSESGFELVQHEMFSSVKKGVKSVKKIPSNIIKGTASACAEGAADGVMNTANKQYKKGVLTEENLTKMTSAAVEGITNGVFKGMTENKVVLGESANVLFQHLSGLLDQVLGKATEVTEKIIRGAASQLLHVIMHPSPATVVTAIIGFLLSTGVILDKSVPYLIAQMRKTFMPILNRMFSRTLSIEQNGNTSVEHQAEFFLNENETCALTATAITVVAAAFGLTKIKTNGGINFFRNVMVGIKDFSFCANSLTIFVKNNIACFSRVIRYISRRMTGKYTLAEDIKGCGDKIAEWARSVKVLTNPMLRDKINHDPRLQYQVFIRDIEGQALTLRNDLSAVPLVEIRSLALKIRQIQEELVADKLCPAARQEPYVIQFFGESNIGKSYIVHEVVHKMLESINYKTYADPIFVRTAGTNYWNGVNRQPCIWMDDVFCVTTGDICLEQMREIFALKSSSVFNPPIAELENKKLRYNPKILMMTSNEAFWSLIGLSEPKALYRRRDALWQVKKKEEYKDIHPGKIDRSITSNFQHLLFRKSSDPSEQDALFSDWMTYDEFIEIACNDFREYDTREMLNYRKRLQDLTRLFPTLPENDLEDLFESSDALLNECAEKIDYLKQARDLTEFKKQIQPVCSSSFKTAFGDKCIEEEKQCLDFLFPEISGVDHPEDVQHEVKLFKQLNTRFDEVVYSACRSNNFKAADEMVELNDLMRRDENALSSSDITRKLYLTKKYTTQETIIDEQEPSTSRVYNPTVKNKKAECRCLGTSNTGVLLCDLHPVTSTTCNRVFNLKNKFLSENPNLFKTCPHIYLTSDYMMDDEASTADKKVLMDRSDPRNFKIPEDFCKKDCFLETTMGKNVIRCLAEQTVGSPMQLAAVEVPLEDIYVPRFIISSYSYLKEDEDVVSSTESYDSLLERTPLVPIRCPKSLLDQFKEFCQRDPIRKVWKILKTILKWLGLAIAGVGLIYFGVQSFMNRGGNGNDSNEPTLGPQPLTASGWDPPKPIQFVDQRPELFQSGSVSTRGHKPNKIERARNLKENVKRLAFVNPESTSYGPNLVDDMLNLFARNMAYLSYYDSEGNEVFKQRLMGLGGGYAITTKHFIQSVQYHKKNDPQGNIVVRRGPSRFKFKWEHLKTIQHDDSSFALIIFPGPLTFKNIMKHIATSDEHAILTSEALFVNYEENRIHTKDIYLDLKYNLRIGGTDSCSPQTLDTVYSYNFHGSGLCGSPIISLKPVPKIIGVHVAGSPSLNQGYAQPILREYFDGLKLIEIAELPVDHQMKITPMFKLENNVLTLGTIPREQSVHLPSKTKIIPTPMYDQICDVITEPAPLSLKDARISHHKKSPIVEGVAKHGLTPDPFDHEILDECQKDLSETIQRCRPVLLSRSKELLTDQEIFGGIIGNDSFGKIEINSSEGYPLILMRPENHCNKKWLFNYVDTGTEKGLILEDLHPTLKEILAFNNNLRKQGRVPSQVFYDCLKDNRIEKEKIPIPGKTRVFSVAPVEYTWSMKRYFGQFQAAYSTSRFFSETAIGINPQSAEWTILYNHLLKLSNNVVVGDYKAFGDRLYWYCIELAFKTIREWYSFHYGDHYNKIREILELELRYSTRLVGNVAYRVMCGIPSGFPLTVEINNLVNQLYMRYAFKITTKLPIAYFNRYVRLVCYGDDLIMTVADNIKEKFNFQTIQKVLSDVKIEFTPADKSSNSPKFWSIDEVTFLKSKFVAHPTRAGVIIPQLPLSSCTEELNWMWDNNDPILTCYESARGCLNNLYGHGPEKFNEVRSKILKWFARQDKGKFEMPHLLSWKDIDERIFGCI